MSKSLNNLKMKRVLPKSCFFVSLLSNFLQFQKQLMTKSETCFGFKRLGNQYIKETLAQINRNLRKKKELHLLLHHTSMVISKCFVHFFQALGLQAVGIIPKHVGKYMKIMF